MEQKFFNVKNPNEIVTILREQSNFYQLSDGVMIKIDSFNEKYQPVLPGFANEIVNENIQPFTQPFTQQTNNETIDPNLFFNTKIKIDASEINKIKSIDPSKVVEQNERTTILKDTTQSITSIPSVTQQVQPSSQPIINEKKDTDIEYINSVFDDEKMVYGENEATLRRNKRLQRLLPPEQQQKIDNQIIQQPLQAKPDPLQMMFSTFKKVHEIKFNIEFKDKIANPEFIKLMMQNMDGDIVSYYKQMVMDNILKNIKTIENIVEQTLKNEIGISDENENETIEIKQKKTKLVAGKLNKSGKQLYKFINDKGKVVEMLKTTAEKKGFKPYEK